MRSYKLGTNGNCSPLGAEVGGEITLGFMR